MSPRRWSVRDCRTRRSFTCTAGSTSPISSRKTEPSGPHDSRKPSRSAAAPVKAPLRWPNSSDSISVGESAERLTATNAGCGRSGETLAPLVERDVARVGDRARHQLFARSGRAGDQRRDVAHARPERTAIAADVVREDRLPDRGPQRGHGTRAADDVAEDLMKGAAHLEEAGEEVRGVGAIAEVCRRRRRESADRNRRASLPRRARSTRGSLRGSARRGSRR